MQKRPYTPPKLRRLSLEDIRALEARHGVTLLGKPEAPSSSRPDSLPKKEGPPWEPTDPTR